MSEEYCPRKGGGRMYGKAVYVQIVSYDVASEFDKTPCFKKINH